jgi:hypothetical protein
MITSLYNFIMTKMRLKELDKTIEALDDDYPVQLLAQKDMLKYEEEHWKIRIGIDAILLLTSLILAITVYFLVLGWKV